MEKLGRFLLLRKGWLAVLLLSLICSTNLFAQGVTTGEIDGLVTDDHGEPLPGANVVAVHQPSGTQYGTAVRNGGAYDLPNMRVGGPYSVTVTFIGYKTQKVDNIFVSLGQTTRLDFKLVQEALQMEMIEVTAEQDEVFNSGRTGVATYISTEQVQTQPTIKRSTRDLIRLDPRNDGNYSFGGRNWLYNNITLDGSYFNNPFGLDDPAPGGQTAAEPVPYEAVEQVVVSVAPFDIRQGGFTGANINTVTKSGTNVFKASAYTFVRNESFQGNTIRGQDVIANPELKFNQSGFTLGGPLIRDKLFFFVNGELERRDDPATNFVATASPSPQFGESRVERSVMDQIRDRMTDVYEYDTGDYDNFIHATDNDKLLVKLDWNVNANNNLTLRYNYLNASRGLPPHPFVLSAFNSGRGPNESSLPFQNSGYQINNELNSFALELNSRSTTFTNRFFASYNRFRDFRVPFSEPFPTIEIADGGVTYTTVGHEPFSIHNILDQDVLQLTNDFSLFKDRHVLTFGANFEFFGFFNSFNIFRHGVFFLPYFVDFEGDGIPNGSTFDTLAEFMAATDPNNPDGPIDFRGMITPSTVPFKGENIDTGQLSVYAQDEYKVTDRINLTFGLRVDFPMYFTTPVDNPFSRNLTALDENDNPETVDQSKLPGANPLFSPRLGFNWDALGDRRTQIRGGTGVFTGRVPFVWIGNVISNPGANPNLYPAVDPPPADHRTSDDSILQQSFDLNAMVDNLKWPQVWNSNIAIDQQLPGNLFATLEFIYGKDLHAVYVRNADLVKPVRLLPDGRPYYGGAGNNELNPDGGAGIYVLDNTSDGRHVNFTAQLRKFFSFGLNASLSYSYTQSKSKLQSTEIASVLWQSQPVQGDPNRPVLSDSQFGIRHRIVGGASYSHRWNNTLATHFGLFFETAEGNRFTASGGNRYSFVYSGDVNGDGASGNDLIYIPRDANDPDEIVLGDIVDANGNVTKTAAQQASELEAFIRQDGYLSSHRGLFAGRNGLVNPWFANLDLRILQDIALQFGKTKHTFQINFDVLNVLNLLSSSWGVRQVASTAATSPLTFTGNFANNGQPIFNFNGVQETFIDDPGIFSRWQIQLGIKYLFN